MLKQLIMVGALLSATATFAATAATEAAPEIQKETVASELTVTKEQPAVGGEKAKCDLVAATLMQKLGLKVSEVNPTPISGLFEAVVQGEIVYVDEFANHLIMGQMFDTASQRNLTEEARERLNKIDFASLPFKDAIKTVNGNGQRTIAVFSDPNCGFCKRLEASLKDMKDVTIYTFLYPVITPSSKEVSANVWCSKDPSTTWKALMIDGKPVSQRVQDCDISSLDRNIELGRKLNVSGTPTVFVSSGHRAPGAIGPEYLEKMLSQAERK